MLWFATALIAILILCILLGLVYLLYAARKRADRVEPAESTPTQDAQQSQLRRLFAAAVKHFESRVGKFRDRYATPWVMLLGESGSGKSTVVENLDFQDSLSLPSRLQASLSGCNWRYMNGGIVLDVSGRVFLSGSGDTGWRNLLRLLQKYRPRRPIDGVILTISSGDLYGDSQPDTEELLSKIEAIYQRLVQIQTITGIRFPVYVLVTQCDRLPGFSALCRQLPERLIAGMFGWSNPYNLDTAYTNEWLDQAFIELGTELETLRAELFAARSNVAGRDEVFCFSTHFQGLRAGLQLYLERLFRQSAYHEALDLRGIYFTGDSGGELAQLAVAESEAEANRPSKRLVFLLELFSRKIFPEHGLARPIQKAWKIGNLAVRAIQFATLVLILGLGAGLIHGYLGALRHKQSLVPVLESIRETQVEVKENKRGAQWMRADIIDLIGEIGSVSRWGLGSVFMPSSLSWFSSTDDKINRAVGLAYKSILITSMASELKHKPQEFIGNQALATGATKPSLDIDNLGEFKQQRQFVTEVGHYEKYVTLYNSLLTKGKGGIAELNDLMNYLFHIGLPKDFEKNQDYYNQEIKRMVGDKNAYVDSAKDKGKIVEKFRGLTDNVYSGLFDRNPVLILGLSVIDEINGIDGNAKISGRSLMTKLIGDIDQLDALLKDPEAFWLTKDSFDLGPSFNRSLSDAADAKNIGPAVVGEVRQEGEMRFAAFRTTFYQRLVNNSKPLIRIDPVSQRPVLTDRVIALRAALNSLSHQNFVQQGEPRKIESGEEGYIKWDAPTLDIALSLHQDYKKYLSELGKAPQDFAIQNLARRELAITLENTIAAAQRFEPPQADASGLSGSDDEMKSFNGARERLSQLLAILRGIGADDTYGVLSGILKEQASRLLMQTDQEFERARLYSTKDGAISGWDGVHPANLSAFDVGDTQELADLLAVQLARVNTFSKRAEPLIAFLSNGDADSLKGPLVKRWRRIAEDLEHYKNKNPGNTVAALEHFIVDDMGKLDAYNCLSQTLPAGGQSGDYFLERRNQLRQNLLARCSDLSYSAAIAAYGNIESAFNQNLAGRFPFVYPSAGKTPPDADFESIVDFFRVYDKYAKTAKLGFASNPRFGEPAQRVKFFLGQMDEVRAFFEPFLAGEPLAFDVAANFRVNRAGEIAGNQVADWVLQIGDQSVRMNGAPRSLRWHLNDSVRFSLRWAKDAPTFPVYDGKMDKAGLGEKEASFEFSDAWSLLNLMLGHIAVPGDFKSALDNKPYTLKFTVPISQGSHGSVTLAKVFVRLVLTPVEKKAKTAVLPNFPERAPHFQADMMAIPLDKMRK